MLNVRSVSRFRRDDPLHVIVGFERWIFSSVPLAILIPLHIKKFFRRDEHVNIIFAGLGESLREIF